MSSAPNPTATLVSLRDLLNGTTLGHDIIIYNGNVYSAGVFNGSTFNEFYRYYIDVSPVLFDKMSKAKTVKINVESGSPLLTAFGGTAVEDGYNVYYQDKDAALYPESVKAAYAVNNTWANYFRPNSPMNNEDLTTGYNVVDFLSCAVQSDSGDTADLIISDEDSVFSATMIFEDGKKAFTKLQLNQQSTSLKVVKLIAGAVLLNSDHSSLIDNLKQFYTDTTTYSSQIAAIRSWVESLINNTTNDILAHIYVWVKAPFAGDYIDPADFNQDLNQDSNVAFANVLIANDYDGVRNNYDRYNESTDITRTTNINEYLERLSRPYCPTNSPLKDFLSESLLGSLKGDTVEDTAKNLISDSYEDTSILGSVLIAPGIALDQNSVLQQTRFTPFNFYDPESREDSDYYINLGRIPTLIGKSGNLTLDGRIMSPTIDEIWYIIKKLISGYKNTEDERFSTVASDNYKGDTSLSEAVGVRYKFNSDNKNYLADPIDFKFSYDSNGNVESVSPLEWVSQPTEVAHKVDAYVKQYSITINKLFDAQNEDEKESRRIENTGDKLKIDDSFNLGVSDAEYGPRSSAPLSLRELEAAILGNKYNIDNSFVFASKTYAVTGKFGKKEINDKNDIISAGSLYQMHRDYNAKVDEPNTYWKKNGDGENGVDAECTDLSGTEEMNGTIKVYILDSNHKRTEKTSTSKLPMMVEHYGNSTLLNEKYGDYNGSEVYMTANGVWKYDKEHIRLPILRSRF